MATRITVAYLERMQKAGKIRGFTESKPAINSKPASLTKPSKMGIAIMKLLLDQMGVVYVKELVFSKTRKFRFDLAIPEKMIAFEYDGLRSKKSRHTTRKGFEMDTQKLNLAQLEGWKVYRYTASTISNFERDLNQIIVS